jgi:hypothetical protein
MEMFNFNLWLLHFLGNYWSLILIFISVFIPLFPPEWFNYDDNFYLQNNSGVVYKIQKKLKLTLLHVIIRLLVISIMTITDFLIYIITYFSYKETLSLIVTVAIGFDIFYSKGLSNESVILVVVSLLILYFEKLVDSGKKMSILGKLFNWERADVTQQQAQVSTVPQSSSSATVPVQTHESNETKPNKERTTEAKNSTSSKKRARAS